jgi:hypothetical protein
VTDINELFKRDPLQLSRTEDIPQIVAYYREKLQQFQLGDKSAGSTKKMKNNGPKPTINLDDILSEIL